jgi:hypothetical protein
MKLARRGKEMELVMEMARRWKEMEIVMERLRYPGVGEDGCGLKMQVTRSKCTEEKPPAL